MRPHKVSKELAGAIREEQKRQAIDAAKKKAVAQHADYDTFKKMVAVAHLQPLQAATTAANQRCLLPAWKLNPSSLQAPRQQAAATSDTSSSSVEGTPAMQSQLQSVPGTQAAAEPETAMDPAPQPTLPRNGQEFCRDWRRHYLTPTAKYRLLKLCGADAMRVIFKVEINGQLLGQILQVLQQEWMQQAQAERQQCKDMQQSHRQQQQQHQQQASTTGLHQEAVFIIQLLHNLTGAGRFDLTVSLLDGKSKQAALQLCCELDAAIQQAAGCTPPCTNSDTSICTSCTSDFSLAFSGLVLDNAASSPLPSACSSTSNEAGMGHATGAAAGEPDGSITAAADASGGSVTADRTNRWPQPAEHGSISRARQQLEHVRQKLRVV